MNDPNKLLAELREWAHDNTCSTPGCRANVHHGAELFQKLDRALSSGMFFPDDWCRTKIKGEDS